MKCDELKAAKNNVYSEPDNIDYIIIKTSDKAVERAGSLYEATRKSWKAQIDKVKKYAYVLSVIGGVVKEVYEVSEWMKSAENEKRLEFVGKVASDEIADLFRGKMIPSYYRKKGMSNPLLYKTQEPDVVKEGGKKKYTIELSARAKGVQLLGIDEDEKEELLEEDIDDIYYDWVEKKDYDFYLEGQYLMSDVDRFNITIKDEDENVVFETNNVEDLLDHHIDEEDLQEGLWNFQGVDDGIYLVRNQTIKGCFYEGEFTIDEPFDEAKLYVLRDVKINDELMGDDVFPIDTLYYQRGEDYLPDRDAIILDFNSDMGEQYVETHLLSVREGDWWENLQK